MVDLKKMYPFENESRITQITNVTPINADTIPIADVSALPSAPNLATIFDKFGTTIETVRYGGKDGNFLTAVERGFNGTTAQSWAAGTDITRAFSAYDHDTNLLNTLILKDLLETGWGEPGQDGVGVPPGGLAGQVLKKNSNDDFDTIWADNEVSSGGEGVTQNQLTEAIEGEAAARNTQIIQAITQEATDRQGEVNELRGEIIDTNAVVDGLRYVKLFEPPSTIPDDVAVLPLTSFAWTENLMAGRTFVRYVNGDEWILGYFAGMYDVDNAYVRTIASSENKDTSFIKTLIPPTASETNQLADKDFVNSSISNMASRYVTPDPQGAETWQSLGALRAGPWYNGGAPYSPNSGDYALFVVTQDDIDNLGVNFPLNSQVRATFSENVWSPTFKVNDTPFTAGQIAAINSGITAALVDKLNGIDLSEIQGDITNLQAQATNSINRISAIEAALAAGQPYGNIGEFTQIGRNTWGAELIGTSAPDNMSPVPFILDMGKIQMWQQGQQYPNYIEMDGNQFVVMYDGGIGERHIYTQTNQSTPIRLTFTIPEQSGGLPMYIQMSVYIQSWDNDQAIWIPFDSISNNETYPQTVVGLQWIQLGGFGGGGNVYPNDLSQAKILDHNAMAKLQDGDSLNNLPRAGTFLAVGGVELLDAPDEYNPVNSIAVIDNTTLKDGYAHQEMRIQPRVYDIYDPGGGGEPPGDLEGIGTLSAGAILRIRENGVPREYQITNQRDLGEDYQAPTGTPGTADATFVQRYRTLPNRQMNPTNVNNYANSAMNGWLNDEVSGFLSTIDESVRDKILSIRIPFRPGAGTSPNVSQGANGLLVKVFLMSVLEVGLSQIAQMPLGEGSAFDFYPEGSPGSVRVAQSDAWNDESWWLRSPMVHNSLSFWRVNTSGNAADSGANNNSQTPRPTFALPSNISVTEDGYISSALLQPSSLQLGITATDTSTDATVTPIRVLHRVQTAGVWGGWYDPLENITPPENGGGYPIETTNITLSYPASETPSGVSTTQAEANMELTYKIQTLESTCLAKGDLETIQTYVDATQFISLPETVSLDAKTTGENIQIPISLFDPSVYETIQLAPNRTVFTDAFGNMAVYSGGYPVTIGDLIQSVTPVKLLVKQVFGTINDNVTVADWDAINIPTPPNNTVIIYRSNYTALNHPEGAGAIMAWGWWDVTATATTGIFYLYAVGSDGTWVREFNQASLTWEDWGQLQGAPYYPTDPGGSIPPDFEIQDLISIDANNAIVLGGDYKLFVPKPISQVEAGNQLAVTSEAVHTAISSAIGQVLGGSF